MHTLSHELRSAREARGLTLQDIADATLINSKFLEAIELGDFTVLPQAYVRAFIREYAQVVGLDPIEVIRRYEETTTGVQHPLGEAESGPDSHAAVPETAVPEQPRPEPTLTRTHIASIAVVVVAAALALYLVFFQESPPPQVEIPFQTMVHENEERAPKKPEAAPRTQAAEAATPRDSLTLRATIVDSVWVSIVIDEQPPREYIFHPNVRATWKGKNRFLVTLGNAGGVQFTLNQKELGALGKRGAVVRDVELSRTSLKN
jgi:cytoskeletal protein RodZ